MATETAPVPAGVQTTYDKPLGPQPAKTRVGDKFRAEFDKLTKPQGQETSPAEPKKEEPVADPPKEEPKVETPEPAKTEEPKPEAKPASPLEAVIAKEPKKEPVKPTVEEPDVLEQFDKIEK